MAAALQNLQSNLNNLQAGESAPVKTLDLPQFAGVFRGRELTLKDRRVASGLPSIDRLIGGGIVRGRISEILGNTGAGKTSLAMRFAAGVTRLEAAAWIETGDNLDPASLIAAGIEPARMLWVSCRDSPANLPKTSPVLAYCSLRTGLPHAPDLVTDWD